MHKDSKHDDGKGGSEEHGLEFEFIADGVTQSKAHGSSQASVPLRRTMPE